MPKVVPSRIDGRDRFVDEADTRPLFSLVASCLNEQEVLPVFIERISCLFEDPDTNDRVERVQAEPD